MIVTQQDIDRITAKHGVCLWAVTLADDDDIKSTVDSLLGSKFQYAEITFPSLASILLSYRDKMTAEEIRMFEDICSFFTGGYADCRWVLDDEGEASYLVFDFQGFSRLLQNAWAGFPNRDLKYYEAEAVEFLKNTSSTFNKIILQLEWGR